MSKRRSTRKERVLAFAAVIGLAVGAAVVLPRGFSASSSNVADTELRTFQAVCEATDRATRGEYENARRIFVDEAHEGLHQLAAALSDIDREAEARLLEAKAGVEAFGNTFTSATTDALGGLRTETARSVAVITKAPPPQC